MKISCSVRLIHCGILCPNGRLWSDASYRVHRIHVPLEGCARYRNSSGITELREGNVYLLVNGVASDLSPVPGSVYRHLYFDFQTTPPLLGDPVVEISLKEDTYLAALLRAAELRAKALCGPDGDGWRPPESDQLLDFEPFLSLVMSHLLRVRPLAMVHNPRVEEALRFIRDHYAEPIGNEEIANVLHVDVRHLFRLFRQELAVSPHRYLSQYRIERACEMLRRGISVSEAAFACGFRSDTAFRQAFRRIMGTSPTRHALSASSRPQPLE